MYWWDHYIRPNDLWYHYAALSRFVSGIDFAGGRFARIRGPEESEVAITGLKSRIEGYIWVQNRESTWRRRIVEGKAPRTLSGVRLGIPNVERGTYRVEWWDTYAGKVITGAEQRDEGGILRLVVPDFPTDVALRFRKLER
jgi:hypothetical protein